ncbi:MAG: hypothetical protein ACREPQ_06840 [Rhodanobacter sp.]
MQVEQRRQPSPDHGRPDDGWPGRGLTPLDPPTQARLRQVRWREPWHERRWHVLALVVAMVLHVLFMLVIWGEMRPLPVSAPPAQPEKVLQVRFITATPAPVVQPPPAPPPLASPRALPKPHEPVSKEAMTIQLPTPKPVDTSRLYDSNGEPRLPAAAASAPTPGYVQNLPKGDAQVMQHNSPVKYQATRFQDDWSGKGNVVDNALQKLVDKTTVKKTIQLPGGVRIHCGISVAMLAGGCSGDPPPPPSAKDGDERLSMAATPLAVDPHAPKPPSVEACIAMYRAGKPLAWGCPVDTPNRAVDAERRDRAAGAASHP